MKTVLVVMATIAVELVVLVSVFTVSYGAHTGTVVIDPVARAAYSPAQLPSLTKIVEGRMIKR